MPEKPSVEVLRERITQHLAAIKGTDKEAEVGLAWAAYIAALIEWQLISPQDHNILHGLLPSYYYKPVLEILLGFPSEETIDIDAYIHEIEKQRLEIEEKRTKS